MHDVANTSPKRVGSDLGFYLAFGVIGGLYIVLIVAILLAMAGFTSPNRLLASFADPEIRYSIRLSLLSSTLTTILSLWVAVALGYVMSRFEFPGKLVLDAILDIPIVLPPLVVGLGLLILFRVPLLDHFENHVLQVTHAIPAVILAQFTVACAFAVRTMRNTFDQISPREEQVALTLGCTRSQAFWRVVFPEARRGLLTAATLSWARALGEFGPVLVFAGATPMSTEVLPTTVQLRLDGGELSAALAVSLLMVLAAVTVLLIVRVVGSDTAFRKGWAK